MRWPTADEFSYAVLVCFVGFVLFLFALGIGLGDRTWFTSAVDLLFAVRDSYGKTVAKAIARIAELEATIKEQDHEIKALVIARDGYKREMNDALAERNRAESSLKDARQQVEEIRQAASERIEMMQHDSKIASQMLVETQRELRQLKNQGAALVEYALLLALIVAGLILAFAPIGGWLMRKYLEVGAPF